MNQWESNIIFKFSNGEIKFNISQFRIFIQFLQDALSECSNNRFLIISDHIREELINEFNFEIGQIEPSVVITVKLIRKIEYDFIFLWLFVGVKEIVDQAVWDMLDLSMAGHQIVKLERDLVRHVQIGDSLSFVRNEHTLHE